MGTVLIQPCQDQCSIEGRPSVALGANYHWTGTSTIEKRSVPFRNQRHNVRRELQTSVFRCSELCTSVSSPTKKKKRRALWQRSPKKWQMNLPSSKSSISSQQDVSLLEFSDDAGITLFLFLLELTLTTEMQGVEQDASRTASCIGTDKNTENWPFGHRNSTFFFCCSLFGKFWGLHADGRGDENSKKTP